MRFARALFGLTLFSVLASAQPVSLGPGRSVQLAAGGSGLMALVAQDRPTGGQDLYSVRLDRVTLRVIARERVNEPPGVVRATGEGGPVFASSPAGAALYVVWNQDDRRHLFANQLRCSRYDASTHQWLRSTLVNDDEAPSTHSFPAAVVGEDGAVYVAWIDRRHNAISGKEDYPGGGDHSHNPEPGASLYVAVSRDGGRTFAKNVYVAGSVCGCCRVSVAVVQQTVVIAWRGIETGDITVGTSSDNGRTWTQPHVAVRDGWKINGCPHVGPTLAAIGNNLYLAWLTGAGAGEGSRIQSAVSKDGARTFSETQYLSKGVRHVNSPHLTEVSGGPLLVFRGTDALGRSAVFGAALTKPTSPTSEVLFSGSPSINYPVASVDYVAWLETTETGSDVRIARR